MTASVRNALIALALTFAWTSPGTSAAALAREGDPSNFGDAPRGSVPREDGDSWAMGLSVPVADGAQRERSVGSAGRLSPAETNFYYLALHHRLNEVVSIGHGSRYGVIGILRLGSAENVMIFQTTIDEEILSYEDLAKEMKVVAAALADPSSIDWWRRYIDDQTRPRLYYGASAAVVRRPADETASTVAFVRVQGSGDAAGPFIRSADEARTGFARMLESADWLVMKPSPGPSAASTRRSARAGIDVFDWDLFGPDLRTQVLAVLCQCLLMLLVLRRVQKKMEGARPAPKTREPGPKAG